MTSSYATDWSVRPLGDLARVYSGGTPLRSVSAYWNGSIPWVTTTEIDFGIIRSARQTISDAGLEASAAKIAPPGTVLIAMYGQGKTRGKSAILGIAAAMNQACAAVEVRRGLSATYLLHYLTANYESIRALSNSGGQENLSGEIVKKIPIAFPSREEQDRIATALDDADSLILGLERLIAKRQAIKQGVMQQLLTGRSRLPGFTEPWSTTTLGALGSFLKGRGVKRDDVRYSGVRCIRYGELYTDFQDYTSEAKSFVSPDVAATALPLRTGDVLFAGSGETRDEIGKCVAYLGPEPAVAGGDVIVLRGGRFNSTFLALLANSPEVVHQKSRAGQGDAVVHIYPQALAAVGVTMPPRDEQDAIAEVIVDVDSEIALLRQRLGKAQAVKQGMMQELLTGRTRLPVTEAVA